MLNSERLYYADSFLSKFQGTVRAVREAAHANGASAWQIAMDRSAFYPTSGGQPYDTGTLTTVSSDAMPLEVAVDAVEEDEAGAVWHFVQQPLAEGTQVEGRIDWARRFDHMQQHTGQHLLSAVFHHELQAATVSFHLGESTSTVDLAIGALSQESLERIERLANGIIGEDRPVVVRYVSREEADAMLGAGELRKLPDRQGAIRLIEIAEYDLNACGGTHVRSTGQIGGLLLRRVEKVTRGMRVEFVCGLRAVRAARADAAVLSETSALLSSGAPELAGSVARLLSDAKAGAKERQKLREELAALEAEKIATEAPLEKGLRLLVRTWADRDRDYVKLLATRTVAAAPSAAVIFCAGDADPVPVFVARSKDLTFDCGKILREALAQFGLRGGGSPDLAQGQVPAAQKEALLAVLEKALRDAVA